MDVGCFFKRVSFISLLSMLCIAHQKDEETIKIKLEHLRRKGLLEHVDLRFDQVIIHDLYLEFIELELGGAFSKSSNLSERMWVNIEGGDMTKLKYKPQGRCWDKLIRLRINCLNYLWARGVGQGGSLKGIKWKYFANIGVLQLQHVHLEHGGLNFVGLVCLRILYINNIGHVKEIEGLGELENLTHFDCYQSVAIFPIGFFIVGQLPASLKLLKIQARAVLASNVLAKCHNLVQLELLHIEALSLDLSNCWSLESANLLATMKLHTLLGLATCQDSCLQSLTITSCQDLVHIPGIDHLICLKELHLDLRWELPMLNFRTLTNLQVLSLWTNENLVMHLECAIPLQLPKLRLHLSKSTERLNLNVFNQLEVLNLSRSYTLTTLATLGDLPKLRRLDLELCQCLEQLPNLSKSRNLEKLKLEGYRALILHERDIQVLSELPLLQPVPFHDQEDLFWKTNYFRLDLHRRKLVVYRGVGSFSYEEEESDLGPPPIDFGNIHHRMEMRKLKDQEMGPEDSESPVSSDFSEFLDYEDHSD